jgi:anhydro-N-acetylmuramic acid kinase
MFYKAIGIMSGTSLDGLDIACVDFSYEDDSWSFELLCAETVQFPQNLCAKLEQARNLNALQMTELDLEFGTFIGNSVLDFIRKHKLDDDELDLIASHGHTVFHQPEKRITLQIGSGQEIARITGIPTVCDFRKKDVLFGGQGAPLVPIGDRDLFAQKYKCDALINLGGFANITLINKDLVRAFDIGPCNLVLNKYAKLLGASYDKGGALGRSSSNEFPLLVQTLNALPYFSAAIPKSLGAEWLDQHFYPLLDIDELTAQDKLGVCYEVISDQIAAVLNENKIQRVLLSGGGAKNEYLIELIQQKSQAENVIPETSIIDYKEALVFAYLGVLYMEAEPNCLSSVTGASEDVCGGVMFGG